MKILIVDDNHKHLAAALDLIREGHEVRTADSYETAIEILKEGGVEVLLTDMLMPAEAAGALGPSGYQYLGHEMTIGFILVLIAAQHKVRFAVMATDMNHHNHPMSAAIDWIKGDSFAIDSMSAWFTHARLRGDGAKDWSAMFSDIVFA